MKATLKSMVAKVMTAGLIAGALMFIAPKKADAQQFSLGVQFGHPVVYPGYYAGRDYYDRVRWEQARRAEIERQEWLRRQEFLRHEQWMRMHRGSPYPYLWTVNS